MIVGLNHFNIEMPREMLADAITFWTSLGLQPGDRPTAFKQDGVWLYATDTASPILHINFIDADEYARRDKSVVNHVGFTVRGSIEDVTNQLSLMGVEYDLWEPIPGAHRALYFKGPAGEYVEFVFADEPVAALQAA